jgi:hypothetical protein
MLGGKSKGADSPDKKGGEKKGKSEYGKAFSESAGSAYKAATSGDAAGFEKSLKDAILTCLEDNGVV